MELLERKMGDTEKISPTIDDKTLVSYLRALEQKMVDKQRDKWLIKKWSILKRNGRC